MRNISGRELRIYRDTLMALMGHILVTLYGEEALDALSDWLYNKRKEEWKERSKTIKDKSPEFFLRFFSNEAHEYEVIRKDKNVLEVKVYKCIHAEVFKKLNATEIGYKLICRGDDAATEGFNPKIRLIRPKILMRGDDCCHFIWKLEEEETKG